jgi:cell division cycle 14
MVCNNMNKCSKDDVVFYDVFDRFHLAVSRVPFTPSAGGAFAYFSIDGVLSYEGFHDDFGPMSLGTVFKFCKIVDDQLESNAGPVAMTTSKASRVLTNAVFLAGSYMIIKLNMRPDEIITKLSALAPHMVSYRDVSPGEQNFHLLAQDCWSGLWRARSLGWVDFSPSGFDPDEYAHYDSGLNADLHEVVPGKLVAMRGPRDLPCSGAWRDVAGGDGGFVRRDFSPGYYAGILPRFGVQAVVRLNEPEYDAAAFERVAAQHAASTAAGAETAGSGEEGKGGRGGIVVVELPFEDCTTPPPEVVAKFLAVAEAVPGALAVHCKAGLGRTGTLIALYMMKNHGFTAREAMGWLRIVRPGSVIGEQQQYLCEKEGAMRRAGERASAAVAAAAVVAASSHTPSAVKAAPSASEVRRLVDRVAARVDARLSAVLAGAGDASPASSAAASPTTSPGSSPCPSPVQGNVPVRHPPPAPEEKRARRAGAAAALAAAVTAAAERRGGRCAAAMTAVGA